MARTSRRHNNNTVVTAALPEKNVFSQSEKIRTALYARLSVEQDDNDTLQNQIAFLTAYVQKHEEFEIFNVYSDNGYSGTSFDRPAFQQMMLDVQTGQVQCIVVKDLSRFGRNFIETGYYIETLLPKLNVRLIAINDRFDSSRQSDKNDITVPVKNMVNDLYARDISKKICVSNEARRKSGNYTIEKSIYGYDIDKERNQLVANPDTAPVVQLIFHWFLEGVKSSEIAKRLNAFDIKTPKEYKYEKEFHMPLEQREYWDSAKIRAILMKDAYTGDRCLGMRRNRLYKNQRKQEWLPREEWTIYKNAHEPLVTREELEEAHRIIEEERNVHKKAREKNAIYDSDRKGMFTSLIFCKKCGIVMHHHNLKYPNGKLKPEGGYYSCRGRGEIKSKRGCGLTIRDGYIQAVVTGQIKLLIRAVIDKDRIAQAAIDNVNANDPCQRFRNRISNLTWKLSEYDEKLIRLYKDLSDGVLEQDDYLELKQKYQDERDNVVLMIENCKFELKEAEGSARRIHELAVNLQPLLDDLVLTKELVEYLIERIEIDEQMNVEIFFKCRDVFEDVLTAKEGEET